ncbi:MAG: monovalent cation/H+ antiporter complex subunit F [Syntrophales bacterium]|jgi:multicomponent Na+:H+ antiporter subunit F|nr:monovalent cation/H+ antiporter complex subunit F [Syntrophales bacterium]MDY0043267.1 monovalent cation/H+ antiporter complex subunit F [Syntrophales bacterium]
MDYFFAAVGLCLCMLVLLALYRVVFGPGIFNRVAAISAIGTKTLVILLIFGLLYQRIDMFIDISMVYALLNFIGCVAAAKYLESRQE